MRSGPLWQLTRWLDALGIAKVVVMGGPAGAPSALQMAIRRPDRVTALVLLLVPPALHLARDEVIEVVLTSLLELLPHASLHELARVDAMPDNILPAFFRAEGLRSDTCARRRLSPSP